RLARREGGGAIRPFVGIAPLDGHGLALEIPKVAEPVAERPEDSHCDRRARTPPRQYADPRRRARRSLRPQRHRNRYRERAEKPTRNARRSTYRITSLRAAARRLGVHPSAVRRALARVAG